MNDTIDIIKLNKAEVLAALYNASAPQGMGIVKFVARPMTTAQAEAELAAIAPDCYFPYLHGRAMKVDLSCGTLNTRLYDRDNGKGAAERALEPLFQRQAKLGYTPLSPSAHHQNQ